MAKLRARKTPAAKLDDPKPAGPESLGGGARVRIDWRRIAVRIVMMTGIMMAVYFTKRGEMVTIASQKEEVKVRSADVTCSEDYAKELSRFPGCAPRKCGRLVLDTVVKPTEVAALLNIARRGLALGGSTGGASILDLHSGALSHGNAFVNIFKLDEARGVFNEQDFKIYSFVKNKIQAAIAEHFGVRQMFLTHPTFFSRITAAPPVTTHDEYWHAHVDKETYESFHYTSLVYLSDFGGDFEGGRFIFIDKDANRTIEPRSGRVSAFTSGSENLHRVEQVTKGTRYAITVSFTCDPKHAISDPILQR